MKLGGTYRLRDVAARHFVALARSLRLDPAEELTRALDMATKLEDAVPGVVQQAKANGLANPFLDQLARLLVARAKSCRDTLHATSRST